MLDTRKLRTLPFWVMFGVKFSQIATVVKSLQVVKIFLSFSTLLLSVAAYGLTMGWWFGIGVVAMLFIHEMGHVVALHRKGLPASVPIFIPFLGAAIFTPKMEDRDTEAYVGYGGPFIGSIAAILCFLLWVVTGRNSDLLLVVSYLGVWINLFNMIPINPLDGGRITQVFGSWIQYIGAIIAVAFVYASGQAGMILLLMILACELRLPLFGHSVILFGLWILMLILTVFHSQQNIWLNILDIWLASVLLVFYISRDTERFLPAWRNAKMRDQLRRIYPNSDYQRLPSGWIARIRFVRQQLDEPVQTNRPYPSIKIRLQWLIAYLVLVGVLFAVITVQNEYLPQSMKSINMSDRSPS
jgi:Zn-dependent protease